MKEYLNILSIIVILLSISCNKNNIIYNDINSRKLPEKNYSQYNEIFQKISYIKYLAFKRCLWIGSDKSPEMLSILDKYAVNIDEFPGYYIMGIIDSVVNITKEKIINDSIYLSKTWITPKGEFRELIGDKRVISYCLELYSSPELDSIIKRRFKNSHYPGLYKIK